MKNRKKELFTYFTIAVLVVSACFFIVHSVQAAGTVDLINVLDGSSDFNFTSPAKNVGDTFVVNISITNAVDLGTWQVAIQWDSSLLGYVSMVLPTDHVFVGKSPIQSPPIATPGLVIMGVSAGPGMGGFTGSGRMAQLTLNITKAVAAGETVRTNISYEGMLSDTFMLDSQSNDITANFEFNIGHYTYSGPPGPATKHDIAVTSVVPASISVIQGSLLNISVTVANIGNFTETFDVGVTGNGASLAANQTVTSLASGASMTLTFTWNTSSSPPASYTIIGLAGPVAGETSTADNSKNGGTVQVQTPGGGEHDIAVAAVSPLNTAISQGFKLNITVTIINKGSSAETFDVSIFANSTQAADNQTVTSLDPGKNITLLFRWNTTGFAVSNYTLSATAGPVAGETSTSDNTLVFGYIYVMLPGDCNNDGKTDFKDIYDLLISHAFNAFTGGLRYNPYMDMNADGRIDMRDLIIIVLNFNKRL